MSNATSAFCPTVKPGLPPSIGPVVGPIIKVRGAVNLLDPPTSSTTTPVAQGHGFYLIMGNIDHCRPKAVMEQVQLAADFRGQLAQRCRWETMATSRSRGDTALNAHASILYTIIANGASSSSSTDS